MKPYEHNGQRLLDVQQLVPLPEAADYVTGVRDKQHRRKVKRSRALVRFSVTVDGQTYSNQAKRRAILRVVQALVRNGVSPLEINEAIPWRQVLFEVPPPEEHLSNGERLAQTYGYQRPKKMWFLGEEDFVHHEGTTYAIAKQWGGRTEDALKILIENFHPANISFEVES